MWNEPENPRQFHQRVIQQRRKQNPLAPGYTTDRGVINESEKIANDVEHVSNQLMKRFDSSTVCESEEKRKLKRAEVKGKEKETKCQNQSGLM